MRDYFHFFLGGVDNNHYGMFFCEVLSTNWYQAGPSLFSSNIGLCFLASQSFVDVDVDSGEICYFHLSVKSSLYGVKS